MMLEKILQLLFGAPDGVHLAIAPLAIAGIGAGLNLLGGLFGHKKQPSATGTETTGFNLDSLPPELRQMLMQRLMESGQLSQQQFQELMNMPDALSFGGLSNQIMGGGADPEFQKRIDALISGSLGNVTNQLQGNLGILRGEAEQAAQGITNQVAGSLGTRGLMGSTPGSAQLARALAPINASLQGTIQQGQSQLGNLAVAGLGQSVQGLLEGQRLGLGRAGLQLNLRQLAEQNRNLLMSNPQIAQLLQLAGTKSTTSSRGPSGSGIGGALSGLGSAFLSQGLGGLLPGQGSTAGASRNVSPFFWGAGAGG